MFARTLLGLAAVFSLATAAPVRADTPVPAGFRNLKPYQVVEQIMAQRQVLSLTDAQFAQLDDLALKIRTEKHRFTHQGGRPHDTRHVPMYTRQKALDQALALLTPEQRTVFVALNSAPLPARQAARYTAPHGKP